MGGRSGMRICECVSVCVCVLLCTHGIVRACVSAYVRAWVGGRVLAFSVKMYHFVCMF